MHLHAGEGRRPRLDYLLAYAHDCFMMYLDDHVIPFSAGHRGNRLGCQATYVSFRDVTFVIFVGFTQWE